MKKEILRIENLKKGSLLKKVQLQLFEREIVYIVFDNIQEKQMFLKIMSGEEEKDYGKVYYDERKIEGQRIKQLLKSKCAIIEKESRLIESVTLVENIFLMQSEVSEKWTHNRRYRTKAKKIFEEFEIDIDVDKPTYKLSTFEKTKVEIMKAYFMGKKILILTSLGNVLSSKEKKELIKLVEKMKNRGLSCVFIEPLEDVEFPYFDTVMIIKHGKTCAIKEVNECDYTMLYRILYYDEIEKRGEGSLFFEETEIVPGIEIRNLCTDYLKKISIKIDKGEIVKLFCIDEKSYEEVIALLCGKRFVISGSVISQGQKREIKENFGLNEGIGIVDGNPIISTLFPELSTLDNLQILLSQKVSGAWISKKYKKSIKLILQDIISDEMWKKTIKELKPAEMQKVLYSKWLLFSPQLLICIQPFAEGDIHAREIAREMIYNLKKRKIPVLIVTSNTAELNYCSGKTVYIYHGEILSAEDANIFLYSS